jgi:hypothetical protein
MGVVEKNKVTKTWMSEIFLKCERLSVGGILLEHLSHCTLDKVATSHRLKMSGT